MKTETIVLNPERRVKLTAYLQPVGGEFANIPRRPAVLILPGGGYFMCSRREGEPVALAYLQAGFQAFVLRYSVGEGTTWPMPLEDYEQAMELIRSRAEEWNLYPDKIAVVGFSAGGHLAAAAATVARHKPAAAVLGYPVTEEEMARACLPSAPGMVEQVDDETAACFLFATRTDPLVPVRNTLRFAAALEAHGIGFEMHIYSYGPHGFSTANSSMEALGTQLCPRAEGWVADSVQWLKELLGDFGDGEMTRPRLSRRVDGAPEL
ncbi:MAG: alpha/beta hydrolase [Oscillospiraceae bacterium]|nr:alpha/beta hydrolase [Oscillospiraceae bacterium]